VKPNEITMNPRFSQNNVHLPGSLASRFRDGEKDMAAAELKVHKAPFIVEQWKLVMMKCDEKCLLLSYTYII
jgi:hypothetical protein